MSLQIAPKIETAPPVPKAPSVQTLLQQWQQEYGLPPRPDGKVGTSAKEIFAEWDAEDAELTSEEATADQQLWIEYQTARQH